MHRVFMALFVVLLARTAAAQSTPESYFLDIHQTFARSGDYVYQGFTVYDTTTFDLRFAIDYTADAAIIPENELSNFIGGRGYRGYGIFDGVFGTKLSVTIPAGRYYAVARSEASASNTIRFEIDYSIELPDSYFYDWYIGDAKMVEPRGGKVWHEFTIERNVRYFLDGCNSGVEVFVIPRSELSNFTAGRSFRYYSDYAGEDNAYPGLWELELSPGDYALVFRNQDSIAHAATWQMERWMPYYGAAASGRGRTGPVTAATVRKPEADGLRLAALDGMQQIRLVFGSPLDAASVSRSRFQVTIDGRTVWPSAIAYDASTSTVRLTVPELAMAPRNTTVSWSELRSGTATLSGSTDPLRTTRQPGAELAMARPSP